MDMTSISDYRDKPPQTGLQVCSRRGRVDSVNCARRTIRAGRSGRRRQNNHPAPAGGIVGYQRRSGDHPGLDLKSQAEAIKPHVGYMAQQFSLYGELSVLENLQFFAELFDVLQARIEKTHETPVEFAGLTDFKDRRAAQLSGGMQKKLALACTLIHQPEICCWMNPPPAWTRSRAANSGTS